jgi:hypothetical protein
MLESLLCRHYSLQKFLLFAYLGNCLSPLNIKFCHPSRVNHWGVVVVYDLVNAKEPYGISWLVFPGHVPNYDLLDVYYLMCEQGLNKKDRNLSESLMCYIISEGVLRSS